MFRVNTEYAGPGPVVHTYMNRADVLAKLTAMNRSSYISSTMGVSFISIVPVHVDTFAKKVRSASYVIDWLAHMIEIHFECGYKIGIIAMSAFSNQCVSQMSTSFPGIRKKFTKTQIEKPAAVSYKSEKTIQCNSPIPDRAMPIENTIAFEFTETTVAVKKYSYS